MFPEDFDPDAAAEGVGLFGLPTRPEDARLVVIPVPWDATTSYRSGTARGPEAVLASSGQVDLFDRETGRPWQRGLAMLPIDPDLKAWNDAARDAREREDIDGVNRMCDRMVARVEELCRAQREQGRIVAVLGGDHSVPFSAIGVLAREAPLSVLHVDAHADLRQAYQGYRWSHASIMANVLDHHPGVERLVQVGIRDFGEREWVRTQEDPRITTFFDGEGSADRWAAPVAALGARVWVSFDIDGLEPALCPATGTPVPGGLRWTDATALLATLAASGREIVGFDVCEVAPGPDASDDGDGWDGNVGARLLYKLCGWALKTAQR